jgi:hypothetical protein
MSDLTFRVILDGKTVGDYDSRWFATLDQVVDFVHDLDPGKYQATVEIIHGDFYLTLDMSAWKYRAAKDTPA